MFLAEQSSFINDATETNFEPFWDKETQTKPRVGENWNAQIWGEYTVGSVSIHTPDDDERSSWLGLTQVLIDDVECGTVQELTKKNEWYLVICNTPLTTHSKSKFELRTTRDVSLCFDGVRVHTDPPQEFKVKAETTHGQILYHSITLTSSLHDKCIKAESIKISFQAWNGSRIGEISVSTTSSTTLYDTNDVSNLWTDWYKQFDVCKFDGDYTDDDNDQTDEDGIYYSVVDSEYQPLSGNDANVLSIGTDPGDSSKKVVQVA